MNSIKSITQSHLESKKSFSSFIPKNLLESLANSADRFRIFDPLTVLRLWIFQLIEGMSCKGVLTKFNISRLEKGLSAVSNNSSCFVRAKNKLPEKVLKEICLKSKLDHKAKSWKNRAVKFVDGTTLTMADTASNQAEYPQNIVNHHNPTS